MSGSKNLWAWTDTLLRCQKIGPPHTIEVSWEKIRHGPGGLPSFWLHLNQEQVALEVAETDPHSLILRMIQDSPVHVGDIDKALAEHCDLAYDAALGVRKEITRSGQVEEVRDPENKKRILLRRVP